MENKVYIKVTYKEYHDKVHDARILSAKLLFQYQNQIKCKI